MNTQLKTISSELLFLPRLNEVLRFKEFENEDDINQIKSEFLEFAKTSGSYDQIRYIDKTGMELVRINYNNGSPDITPSDQLQNKGNRYYFLESIAVPDGSIYISPFDLNIEHGEIEQPLKPMIRFGTPVFNNNKELKGIVILNFLGQQLIDNLLDATKAHSGTYSLLNSDGYWLFNNNPNNEWGFMYPDRKDLKLPITDPALWESINQSGPVQILKDETLYTSERISLTDHSLSADKSDYFILLNTVSKKEMGINKSLLTAVRRKIITFSALPLFILALLLTQLIRQRNQYRKELKESALYDQLTGLPNRTLLNERGNSAAAHAKRYNHIYAVMFLDLDGFKPVNDTYGHNTGDKLLCKTAEILESKIRNSDTAARFGGDEFIILLSVINNIDDCAVIAEKILRSLSEKIQIDENSIQIGSSIGITAVTPESELNFSDVMLAADAAMYEVKKSGKNNYKIVVV